MTSPKSKKIFQAVVVTALVLLLCGGGASAQTLRVGAEAVVKNTYEPGKGFIGLKLRNGPGLKAPQTGNLPEDTRVKIIGGPVSKDGHTWWNVESPVGKGWCSGNWLVQAPSVTVSPVTPLGPKPPTPAQPVPGGTTPPPIIPLTAAPVPANTQKLLEITNEIQRLEKEMMVGQYKLPEYLPGSSKSTLMGGVFGTKDYDKHWYEAKNYHDLALQQLRQASNSARSGNAKEAESYLGQAKQSLQKFLAEASDAPTAWDKHLEKVERYTRIVSMVADSSLSLLARLVPGGGEMVGLFLVERDAVITLVFGENKGKVLGDATTKMVISAIFDVYLGGKPVEGLGKIDLPVLAKRLIEDQNFRGRVTQEVVKGLPEEVAQEIAPFIQDKSPKIMDVFADYLKTTAQQKSRLQATIPPSPMAQGPVTPPIPSRLVTPTEPFNPPFGGNPPSTPSTSPTPVPPPTQGLKVGKEAGVYNTYEPGKGYIGLKLRKEPGLNAPQISTLPEGDRVKIIGGPESRDGYTWWHVQSSAGKGWVVGNWLLPSVFFQKD